jgi:SAM-dependent methyltransferase
MQAVLPVMNAHVEPAPSEWVLRWAAWVAAGATVLDVAGGTGRHARVFALQGCAVTLVDVSEAALAQARQIAGVEVMQADLENAPWPFQAAQFDVVVVTNYLWRPRFDNLLAALKPGGLLIYETFARGQETIGRPSRTEFLLEPGELLKRCEGMDILAYEHLRLANPDRFVQRICARAH